MAAIRCTRVEDGSVTIVQSKDRVAFNEVAYYPGQTFIDGSEATAAVTLSYAEAFEILMKECPCHLRTLLEQTRIVGKGLKQKLLS